MVKFGNIEVSDLRLGSTQPKAVYFGDELVWQHEEPTPPVSTTYVKYTAASGLPDWEGDIVGTLNSNSIPDRLSSESVEVGTHVTSIGSYAFDSCTNLTSVTIGNGVTSIGQSVFWGCTNLTSVTIPDGVESIGSHAFRECSGLTSVTIPNSVTSIGEWAFDSCSGLRRVTIGNGVTSIGNGAFHNCTSITSVTMTGKDISTVQGMTNYSWNLPTGCVIHCSDGDITL